MALVKRYGAIVAFTVLTLVTIGGFVQVERLQEHDKQEAVEREEAICHRQNLLRRALREYVSEITEINVSPPNPSVDLATAEYVGNLIRAEIEANSKVFLKKVPLLDCADPSRL